MGFQFGSYNLRIEEIFYQEIGILGLGLTQVTLGIVLELD